MKDTKFKTVAYIITILFSLMILFPLLYVLSNAMKDSASVYDVPPKMVPNNANSVSVVANYDTVSAGMSQEELLKAIQQDHVAVMMACVNEMQHESVFEVKFYATVNGNTTYYARAHRAEIDLEKDNGIFRGAAITPNTLAQPARWTALVEKLGYQYDPNGIAKYLAPTIQTGEIETTVQHIFEEQYPLTGKFQRSFVH